MGGLATKGTWFQNTWEMAGLLGIQVGDDTRDAMTLVDLMPWSPFHLDDCN